MGKKKPVSYGDLHFDTQTEARAFLNAMLGKYDSADRVSAADAVILTAMLALHPDAAQRIGPGIRNFSVRSADFGTKCWVNRIAGTTQNSRTRPACKSPRSQVCLSNICTADIPKPVQEEP